MALYELVYVSLAAAEMDTPELVALLNEAQASNRRQNITGLLVYHRREFMQILEGEQDTVQAVYARIALDDRHQQLHLMYEGPIAQRAFTDWSMAFLAPPRETVESCAEQARFLQSRHALLSQGVPSAGRTFMLNLWQDFLRPH